MPEHPGRYFESVIDLDNGSELKLDVNERSLPWSTDAILREADLQYSLMSLSVLTHLMRKQQSIAAFDRYLNVAGFQVFP